MRKIGGNKKNRQPKSNIIKQLNKPEEVQFVAARFLQIVDQVENPRTRSCDYPLNEILLVAIMAVLCGAESHEDMATFGEAQIEWFKQFVPLENGVPSHDTFRFTAGSPNYKQYSGQWSLRLLANQMVVLEVADSVSHETIRQTLKKRLYSGSGLMNSFRTICR